jgi:hypothetical protein
MILPRDCVDLIVDHLPITQIVNACLALCLKSDIRDVIRHRVDHRRFLSKIVPDPDRLLQSMKKHKYILVSEAVSEYFVPTFGKKEMLWEFILPNGCNEAIQDLELMGIKCTTRHRTFDLGITWMTEFSCTAPLLQSPHKIVIKESDKNPIDYVLSLPVTAIQCFVGYFGAVHMYGALSAYSMMMAHDDILKRWESRVEIHLIENCKKHSNTRHLSEILRHRLSATGKDIQSSTTELSTLIYDFASTIENMYNKSNSSLNTGGVNRLYDLIINTPLRKKMTDIEYNILTSISLFRMLVSMNLSPCVCMDNKAQQYLQMYCDLGYSLIDFESYTTVSCVRTYRPLVPDKGRNLSDRGSTVIFFSHDGVRNKALIRQYMQRYSWYETKGGLHIRSDRDAESHGTKAEIGDPARLILE